MDSKILKIFCMSADYLLSDFFKKKFQVNSEKQISSSYYHLFLIYIGNTQTYRSTTNKLIFGFKGP